MNIFTKFMRKVIQLFLSSIFLLACNPGGNELEEKEQTIKLSYIAWTCDCANWATPEDIEKFYDNIGDSLAHLSIFIEAADSSLTLPDTLGFGGDLIRFTGRFYKKKGFQKDTSPSNILIKPGFFDIQRITQSRVITDSTKMRVTSKNDRSPLQ